MNKEYRTEEQFISLMENAHNGNWRDAFRQAEQHGFFAQDLIRHYENTAEIYGWDFENLIYIAEGAQKLR